MGLSQNQEAAGWSHVRSCDPWGARRSVFFHDRAIAVLKDTYHDVYIDIELYVHAYVRT